MKKKLKSFLIRKNLYYRIRYSRLFRFYQLLFKSGEIKNQKKEIEFYKSFLPPCALIFDIGAYDGHKTAAFLKIAEKVVSCEPDPESFAILEARFGKRALVFLENKALANTVGESHLLIHHPGSAFNTLSPEWRELLENDKGQKWNEKIKFSNEIVVYTTTLDLLIKKYGRPGFIKIDVEGYEEYVLQGLSQRVPFLSFEGLWPEGKRAVEKCFERINHLDTAASCNIAAYEKLILPAYISIGDMLAWLDDNNVPHFEIIVKMSQ